MATVCAQRKDKQNKKPRTYCNYGVLWWSLRGSNSRPPVRKHTVFHALCTFMYIIYIPLCFILFNALFYCSILSWWLQSGDIVKLADYSASFLITAWYSRGLITDNVSISSSIVSITLYMSLPLMAFINALPL